VPLLLGVLPRVVGLMLLGTAVWRMGLLSNPRRHLALYRAVALVGLAIGGGGTALEILEQEGGLQLGVLGRVVSSCAIVPFALGYVALFFWAVATGHRAWRIFAPIGRMALTSYVAQSIVLGLFFFGYGLGLCGRLPSTPGGARRDRLLRVPGWCEPSVALAVAVRPARVGLALTHVRIRSAFASQPDGIGSCADPSLSRIAQGRAASSSSAVVQDHSQPNAWVETSSVERQLGSVSQIAPKVVPATASSRASRSASAITR
jgi:uncharacterized protein DUF418